jgi:tripartite-type tricarboxylate transporter receptor subunit TctC
MRPNMLRTATAVVLSLLAWSAAAPSALAQAWPQRSVKFIVPLGPGAGADITARLLADRLQAKWGQPVVVENRPGGDGTVAVTAFTSAQDDHTLLLSPTSSFTHHPWTNEKMPYDARELVPIARLTNTIVAVVVPASSPIKSVGELFEKAKKEPGKLNWATITGFFDFVFDGFQKKANVQITKVPYRNTVQAANDLAEGRIDLMMAAYAIVRPLVQAGKLKVLAVTASERAAALPDVPTTAEAGFPDLTIDGLVGFFGPRNLPPAAAERIAADTRELLADATINERLTATGQVVNFGPAAEFKAAIDKQRAQAATAGQVLGIKPAQ